MGILKVIQPYTVFTGLDGKPLENGFIYIGSINQNPETAPVSVYWDEAMTQPVAQPIRTFSGYPSRLGTPSPIYVNSDYSITVRDKNRVLVFTAPISSEYQLSLSLSSGSSLVGFIQAGTGAELRTVQSRLRDTISVFDFMTVAQITDVQNKTKSLDVSGAIQEAVNFAKGRYIFMPIGTYRIDSPIELNWSSEVGTIYEQGTKIIGESTIDTIIINRFAGYGLKHSVTSAQAAASKRMTNGELSGFSIQFDASSPVGAAGIKLFSFWFGRIEDVMISGSKEHGIYLPVDPAISANPDNYSCAQLRVERCDIRSSTGWGINAGMFSIIWIIDSCYIVNNLLGGVYTAGSGHSVVNTAIAGNGTNSASVGLHIAHAGVGSPHNVHIRDNEMDNNWGCHIKLEGYSHIVEQNRFIQDASQGSGGVNYRNTHCVRIDPTLTGISACSVSNNLFRFDNPGVATLICIHAEPVAGSTGNQCINNIFSSSPASVVRYSFPSNRARNFAVEDGQQVAGSDSNKYGYGQLSVVIPQNLDMTTAGVKLPFLAVYDTQGRWFTGANQFYVPLYSGVLKISANLLIRHTVTANTPVTIQIKKNGVVVQTFTYPSGFPALALDYSISFSHTMLIAAGDQIEIWGVATTASGTFSIGDGQTISFQML